MYLIALDHCVPDFPTPGQVPDRELVQPEADVPQSTLDPEPGPILDHEPIKQHEKTLN